MKDHSTIDDILRSALDEIDIPESKREEAVARYEALKSQSPHIYPQGSFLLGTAIKPLRGEEFDVDLVCQLDSPVPGLSAEELYRAIGERLGRNGVYRNMLVPKTRCWRLDYASEFHMDILPAIADASGRSLTAIRVPDREGGFSWSLSDPLGYAAWFREQEAEVSRMRRQTIFEESEASGRMVYASVDDVPEHKVRTPLQRVVQMLKRHRDIMFSAPPYSTADPRGDDTPISIIITTLAGEAYGNSATEGIWESLQLVVPRMIDILRTNGYVLKNPVNPNEEFTDKWGAVPRKKQYFLAWLEQLHVDINQVHARERGLHKLGASFVPWFGGGVLRNAMRRSGARVTDKRLSGDLKVSSRSGALSTDAGAAGPRVKNHTFWS